MIVRNGIMYYDPRTHRFVHVRGYHDDYLVCGGFAEYYNDAKASPQEVLISHDYIRGCEEVIAVDQCEAAEFDGIGWRVRKEGRK